MSLAEKKTLLESASRCVLLHEGGEACVYLLRLDNGERLILKWYRQPFNKALVEKIQKVRDDGISKILESGIYENTPYQLYEYVKGVASDTLPRIPVAVALSSLRQVAASLMKASKEGASHGDLNPCNVIFSMKDGKEGGALQTVLIDWGITGPGALAYAAPERFKGKEPNELSDIFSLGVLLFRWVVGRDLVDARSFDEFASKISELDVSGIDQRLILEGFSPEEVSSLSPIWRATLCGSPDERACDFDELDELLEIALGKVGGGDVALLSALEKFQMDLCPLIHKAEQNVSALMESKELDKFPFKKNSPKSCKKAIKIAVLLVAVFLVLCVAIFFGSGTEIPNVDDTAKIILDNSRSLDMDYEDSSSEKTEVEDSASVHQFLKELPTPTKE